MRFPKDLRHRRRQPEIMDQAGLDADEHHRALIALGRINWWSAGVPAIWPLVRDHCRRLLKQGDERAVRLLDVATGGGDLPVRLWKKARRAGLRLEVAGCDVSPLAIEHARDRARRQRADVDFFIHDVVAGPLPRGYDIVMSSLFLHHLGESEAVAFLRAMKAAAGLVLIDDLRRGVLGWALAYVGVRALSRSKVAHVDGPISVEGAFTLDEARALASLADWSDFEARPRWPCRFLLVGRGL